MNSKYIYSQWFYHPIKRKESWRETIGTGLIMILSLAVIALLYASTLKGGV